MRHGIQEFNRKHVLVPADTVANNVVVVCSLHFINTLKQELNGTKAYEETSIDEKSVVIGHFQSIKIDVWLNFLKTTNTIRIGEIASLMSI